MLADSYPCYVANRARHASRDLVVTDKDSGLAREGVRFAIEDMSEVRLLVTRTPPVS
ncbi:MAG: uncharacterized UPF0146 family protein [Chlamydiales bacterium]|jgi:uncharacterized UPF0146 family protein